MARPTASARETSPGAPDQPVPLFPEHTDWLRNTLAVTGPTEQVARFGSAAAGAGVIPWKFDLDQLEEDFFLPLAAPADGVRAISLQGARILARRLRDAAVANHQRAVTLMLTDRRCPFDLHRLLPVPAAILGLGPDDPATRAWLWTHWGTTRALRQVRPMPGELDGRRKRMAEFRVTFWSGDWSPWHAVRRLRRDWPDLSFVLQPDYGDVDAGQGALPVRNPNGRRGRTRMPTRSAAARPSLANRG